MSEKFSEDYECGYSDGYKDGFIEAHEEIINVAEDRIEKIKKVRGTK